MQQVELSSPFDAHMHWRQDDMLKRVAPYSVAQFAGGLLMPNTTPKILSFKEMDEWYKPQVLNAVSGTSFFPLLTYYLSPELTKEDLLNAMSFNRAYCKFAGVKYYPKGGTTNSDKGMSGFTEVDHILCFMEKNNIPLLIHGEIANISGKVIDDYDREAIFYEQEMEELRRRYPGLPLVMEHITTLQAAEFVMRHHNIRATITPQHLLFDRRALFNGLTTTVDSFYYDENKNGMHPSLMCRPILKSEEDVLYLRRMLILQHKEGFHKFGLGTDTAPHTSDKKYCECGACGVFSAPIALEMYAMAFDQMGILPHLQIFASVIMPKFYGIIDLLRHKPVMLRKIPQVVQPSYEGIVTPFAGQKIPWRQLQIHMGDM